MGYIFRTADNKILVVDGGTYDDTDHLLHTLQKLSGKDIPHIDAWFLTHPHNDHIDAFMEIMRNRPCAVTVDAIYYNFPSSQFIERTQPQFAHTIRAFYKLLPEFSEHTCIITQGDRYYIGQTSVEVLYTHDPSFTDNSVNNATSVLRFTTNGKRILFLGDLGREGGAKLLSLHGNGLKSDFCQMAHHGQAGVDEDVYQAIAPAACLWCAPDWLYDNNAGLGFNTHQWQTVTVRGWMEKLGVSQHFVEKDGDQLIPL